MSAIAGPGPSSSSPKQWKSDYLLEQPSERLPDDLQGLKLGLKLELCHLTNELQTVEFEFRLSQLLVPNLSQAKQLF